MEQALSQKAEPLSSEPYAMELEGVSFSYGKTEVDTEPDEWEDETATGAYFYTFNDYLKVVAEYNQNKIEQGDAEETTDTIALGGIISF